jgi:hypothetical protein
LFWNGFLQRIFCAPLLMFATVQFSAAAPIDYGDFMGNSVTFLDVIENSATDPDHFPPVVSPPNPNAGLYGPPTLSGDSLDFTPINFDAISQFSSPPFDQTDGHLTFMVEAKPNQFIQNIDFFEGGSLTLAGTGTDSTRVDVSGVGFINVTHIDGAAVNVVQIPIDLKFSFGSNAGTDNGTRLLGTNGPVNGFSWTGNQLINIKQELINRGIPVVNGATKISVNFDNTLLAQSEQLAGAFIDKKDFFIVTINIPEPTSCLLALAGAFAGLLLMRRRPGR